MVIDASQWVHWTMGRVEERATDDGASPIGGIRFPCRAGREAVRYCD